MDGNYSTKSAYTLLLGVDFNHYHEAWANLWKLKVSPKVRHFIWRLCTGTLPTRSLLKIRHLIEDDHCKWCNVEIETAYHALFFYRRAKELWQGSGCERLLPSDDQEEIYEVLQRWKTYDKKLVQKASFLVWCIWRERNVKIFENRETPSSVIRARAERLAKEHGEYTNKIYGQPGKVTKTSSKRWVAPLDNVLKMNVDASLTCEGWVGLGVMLRNNTEEIVMVAVRRVQATWPTNLIERKALLMATTLAKQHKFENVILESDCQVLINRLRKGATHSIDLDIVLEDILANCVDFRSLYWSYVKREANYVARHLAKLVPFGDEHVWINHCPREIAPYVVSNTLCLD